MLNVKKAIEDHKGTICLEGRLDTVSAPEMEKELKGYLDDVDELTLDFEKLEYLSSAGLRVLLSLQKTMAEKDGMKLINVNGEIKGIFEITGFSEILKIE